MVSAKIERMRSRFLTLILLPLLSVVIPRPALATEVDNFSGREALTQDALAVLDAEVNRILRNAIQSSNHDAPDRCNRVQLRQEMVRWIGPDPTGIFELWATVTGSIQRTTVGFSESIYDGASLYESPAMRLVGIGRSFKLAGHVVGTDKIGHFFLQGLGYFKRVHDDHAELVHVLRDEHGEDGIWGMPFTGVKSYGDMATNFAGFRFWSNLYDGPNPYVRCEEGRRWVKLRDFSWAEYVTDGWDEAINCSEFSPTLKVAVARNLNRLGVECPVRPESCERLSRLEYSEYWLSPACRSAGQVEAAKRAKPAPNRSLATPR
jgi:hypothetical protein